MSHAGVKKWRGTERSLRSRDGRRRPSLRKRFENREWSPSDGRMEWDDPLTIESGTKPRDALEC